MIDFERHFSEKDIVKLGNPLLYSRSRSVKKEQKAQLIKIFDAMKSCLDACRLRFGFGRGIAAVQIGILKRMILIDLSSPIYIINPQITYRSRETFELWDNCLSFPDLLVRVRRHRKIEVSFLNLEWERVHLEFNDDLAELFQHEFDHLNGVLAINRAINRRAFALAGEIAEKI